MSKELHATKCRACLFPLKAATNCVPIFKVYKSNTLLSHMIAETIHILPEPTDNLGVNVCKLCAELYEFRLSYLESERKLRDALRNFEMSQRLTASCSDSISSLSNIEEDSVHFNYDKTTTDPLNSLECVECGRRFERELELRIHSHTHRKNDPPSQDSQNGFDEQFLLANIKSEVSQNDVLENLLGVQNDEDSELRWKCTICEERFLRRAHLRVHRRQHATDGHRPVKMNDKKSKDQDNKTIPLMKQDKNTISAFKKKANFNLNMSADAQFDRWQCKKCFSSFRTRRLLRDHSIVHRPNTSVTSIDFDTSLLLQNSTADETNSSQLFEHLDNMIDDESTKIPPKKSNQSPKSQSVSVKGESRKHKLSHHTFEIKLNLKSKNFVSDKKNVSFDLSSPSSSSKKQKVCHSQFTERDWPCNSCHQVFNRRSILREHRRTVHMLKPNDAPITMKQELDNFGANEITAD